MKYCKRILCAILVLICLSLCCCAPKTKSLTSDYTRSEAIPQYDFYSEDKITPENYTDFTKAYLEFCAKLLPELEPDKTTVVSPLSLYTALMMAANGADGKTLNEFEEVLGKDINIDDLNTYIHYLNSRVTALNGKESKVTSANSAWINDSFSVKSQFLQTMVNYFDGEVFRTTLNNNEGSDKINRWINDKTDGEITDMVNNLQADTALILVNALLFDDKWINPYTESDLSTAAFNGIKGEEEATFMTSNEMLMESKNAKGFVKSFEKTPCKFVAVLPNEDIKIDDYIISLSEKELSDLFGSVNGVNRCIASIPEFKTESSHYLNKNLKSMGLDLAFTDKADFSNLTMSEGVYLSDVLQKCFVEISPEGARAGAATAVQLNGSAANTDIQELKFDRPFIFMIIENESNLPLFMGVVKSLA